LSKFTVVSADSHVLEPASMWPEYLEPAYRDRGPHVVRAPSIIFPGHESDTYFIGDQRAQELIANSGAGISFSKVPDLTVDAVYPGAYDPNARVPEIARDGVDAEVIYPSVGMRVFTHPDADLRRACFRAYNSWIADFCRAQPDRFKAVAPIDLEDLDAAIAEARRARDLGLTGLMLAIAADDPELYADTRFDRFWAFAEELGLPVSLHINTNRKPFSSMRSTAGHTTVMVPIMGVLTVMIFNGLFLRFPRLKVVSAESDGGWAGYFVERMDRVFTMAIRTGRYPIDDAEMLPSAYFRRNVALTFLRDKTAVEVRNWIGVENLLWSSDYPHGDSTFPGSADTIAYVLEGVPEPEAALIRAGNAERLYGFA
jgi:predicted TIM-barrel fold metal-dependent hydrolase